MRLPTTILPTRRLLRPSRLPSALSPVPFRSASFGVQPSPPRLPKEEQAIFEDLQRRSTGAFSTPRAPEPVPEVSESATEAQSKSTEKEVLDASIKASGEGEELHPHIRRGAKPEFEGDVNPKTGEVGGPKNEPLRWGAVGDYSYNGRVTDF